MLLRLLWDPSSGPVYAFLRFLARSALIAAVPAAIVLAFFPPSLGTVVVLMTIVGAAMALNPGADPHAGWKLAGFVALVIFAGVQIMAINRDEERRAKTAEEQRKSFAEMLNGVQTMLSEQRKALSEQRSGFSTTQEDQRKWFTGLLESQNRQFSAMLTSHGELLRETRKQFAATEQRFDETSRSLATTSNKLDDTAHVLAGAAQSIGVLLHHAAGACGPGGKIVRNPDGTFGFSCTVTVKGVSGEGVAGAVCVETDSHKCPQPARAPKAP